MELPPLMLEPEKATLLNTGQAVRAERNSGVNSYNVSRDRLLNYLRIRDLPTEEMANQVMVIRLDYA